MTANNLSALPPTTTHTIIFPLNNASQIYETFFYTSNLTDGRVGPEEIEQGLQEIFDKRKPFNKKITNASYVNFFFILICVLGMLYMLITMNFGDGTHNTLLLALIGGICHYFHSNYKYIFFLCN